ncbi:MAG: sigma-54 dependent transcriptional regulator [Gammaproteobacteria bacterium]
MDKPLVLVIDDEPDIRELLSITLQRMKLRVETAEDVTSAKTLLESGRVDLCLTDMRLPDGDGLELVEWIQQHCASIPVAVITAHGNVETAVRALKIGAFDFVSKPVQVGDLRKIVDTALRLERPSADGAGSLGNENDNDGATTLIGASSSMAELRRMIAKVARSQAPVHITGESGTGKELVARMIHDSGPRAEAPFVPVNCGAIPTELMEGELFGHRKGSFTGATEDKQGMVRSAEGGTLFLDEIADLPLHMQVKLLRVIQERSVRPVGETRESPVDVRFLSASHRDLARMVTRGEFREDLFYRLNVIEMRVPPLRERDADVLLLADHILARLGTEMEIDSPALTRAARKKLRQHGFPGNVRELENVLERAMTLCEDGQIDADDIQTRSPQTTSSASSSATSGATPNARPSDPPSSNEGGLGSQLEDVERDAIVQALEQTRYNKTAAAKLLGISFRALRYRIKKLGLE